MADDKSSPVLVSACLLGVRCRYDGNACPAPGLAGRIGRRPVIPVCPEQLGGLPTPRPPADCRGGTGEDVLDGTATICVCCTGTDVTAHFLEGAKEVARLADEFGAELAILKSRSPSCGYGTVHREGQVVEGNGVTAALLLRRGLRITSVDAEARRIGGF